MSAFQIHRTRRYPWRLATGAAGACLAALLASACGGGGDGSSPLGGINGGGLNGGGTPVGGINGGGLARGVITGFGSIFVNGVEFSTAGATIRVEDSVVTEASLRVGQVVVVQGTISDDGRTGTARTVAYNDDVEGPVQSVNAATSSFVVLGQTVRVTPTTVFDGGITPASIAGLTPGVLVEVSGLPDSVGAIVATRVERKGSGGELEVTGRVASLDSTARRFSLNLLVVDYSAATLTNGTLANGACVEARGASTSAAGALVASRVEIKSCGLPASSGDRGEIEGLITRFASAADFDVGGQRVTTSAATTFVAGGAPAAATDLRLDLKVEAEGAFNAAGVLEARRVEIRPDSSSRLLGSVDSINTAASSVAIFGIGVTVNAATRLEDKSPARVSPLRFSDLRTGDYLEVRGYRGSSASSIIATLVERNSADPRRELQGQVASVARPNLVVLGVTIVSGSGTQFRNVDDAPMGADAFFAAAQGRLVKARGSWNGSSFLASELELESP